MPWVVKWGFTIIVDGPNFINELHRMAGTKNELKKSIVSMAISLDISLVP